MITNKATTWPSGENAQLLKCALRFDSQLRRVTLVSLRVRNYIEDTIFSCFSEVTCGTKGVVPLKADNGVSAFHFETKIGTFCRILPYPPIEFATLGIERETKRLRPFAGVPVCCEPCTTFDGKLSL